MVSNPNLTSSLFRYEAQGGEDNQIIQENAFTLQECLTRKAGDPEPEKGKRRNEKRTGRLQEADRRDDSSDELYDRRNEQTTKTGRDAGKYNFKHPSAEQQIGLLVSVIVNTNLCSST